MKAELKNLVAPLLATLLEDYRPTGPFSILVEATIGFIGGDGGDLFSFTVCTSDWFEANCVPKGGGVASARHFLFVRQFNYVALEKFIRSYCASCEGDTWNDVVQKLARLGHWEFEDYRSDTTPLPSPP